MLPSILIDSGTLARIRMQYRFCVPIEFLGSLNMFHVRRKTISDLRDTHKMNKYRRFVIYVWANLHWIIHTYCIFSKATRNAVHYCAQKDNEQRKLSFHGFTGREKNPYNLRGLHWTIRDSCDYSTDLYLKNRKFLSLPLSFTIIWEIEPNPGKIKI